MMLILWQLKKRCNTSDVCVIRLLDYQKFPRHLKDCAYMHAYQPVVIQVALNVLFLQCFDAVGWAAGRASGL